MRFLSRRTRGLCAPSQWMPKIGINRAWISTPISDRVLRNCSPLLELLDECGVKATFFVQGLVAEAFPGLVRTFLRQGHEVQSHGHSHRPLFPMSRAELQRELKYARKTGEDAAGVKLTIFRAQDFSIGRDNLWALELVADAGFEVDSSIFPMRTKRSASRAGPFVLLGVGCKTEPCSSRCQWRY
jgi:peptidoglycan/xylan/chitin deacetylase (PgdA/CDA1 family)